MLKNSENSYIQGIAILSATSVVTQAATFVFLGVYTHYMSVAEFGQASLLQTVISVISILSTFGIEAAVNRFYFKEVDNKTNYRKQVITIGMAIVIGFWMLVAIVILLFWERLSPQLLKLSPEDAIWFLPIILLSPFMMGMVGVNKAISLAQKKYIVVAIGEFINFTVLNVYLIIEITLNGHITAYHWIMAYLVGRIGYLFGVLIWQTAPFLTSLKQVWETNVAHEILLFSWPIGVHSLASLLLMQVDRFILVQYLSLDQIGLYMFASSIVLNAQILLLDKAREAITPHYYEAANQGNYNRLNKMIDMTLWLPILGILLTFAFSPLLNYVLDTTYKGVSFILNVLIVRIIGYSIYATYVYALLYLGKTKVIMIVTLSGMLSNIGLNMLLIPIYGLWGAVATALIAQILFFGGLTMLLAKSYQPSLVHLCQLPSGSYLLLLITWILLVNLSSDIYRVAVGISIFLIYLVYNKHKLTDIINIRKEKKTYG